MKASKKTRIPSLRHCNGRGFVDLNGKRMYLGPWSAPETQDAYDRTIAEWLANKKTLPVSQWEITITELCRDYWEHCKEYYRKPDGTLSSSIDRAKQALSPLRKQYGSTLANDFGPKALRTIRFQWVDRGLSRKTVNDYTAVIKQLFKWATSHEKVSVTVYQSISTIDGLKAGRSHAKEREPIKPVPQSHIDAVQEHVSRQVWALIQLQLLTGARGGELVKLRAIDLDTSGTVWEARLNHHKTAYTGHERTIYFGPNAQALLKEFMTDRPLDAFMFNPIEAEKERYAKAKGHRRPDQKPNKRKTSRQLGDFYTSTSYRRAIKRACLKADVSEWTPHRLRHNSATLIRREYGLEAAQVILGHAKADVTQLYAEVDKTKALAVIQEIG